MWDLGRPSHVHSFNLVQQIVYILFGPCSPTLLETNYTSFPRFAKKYENDDTKGL